jgi:hypothetical protein
MTSGRGRAPSGGTQLHAGSTPGGGVQPPGEKTQPTWEATRRPYHGARLAVRLPARVPNDPARRRHRALVTIGGSTEGCCCRPCRRRVCWRSADSHHHVVARVDQALSSRRSHRSAPPTGHPLPHRHRHDRTAAARTDGWACWPSAAAGCIRGRGTVDGGVRVIARAPWPRRAAGCSTAGRRPAWRRRRTARSRGHSGCAAAGIRPARRSSAPPSSGSGPAAARTRPHSGRCGP